MTHVALPGRSFNFSDFELVEEPEKPVVQLNQYVLAAKLGKGSAGKVYLAVDDETDEKFAAKAIKCGCHYGLGGSSSDLGREIRAMRDLAHPNVIGLREVLHRRDTDTVFLIMDYAEHGTLLGKVLEEDDLRAAFSQVCAGMQYLHNNGFVHRDVKPSNILLFGDGTVKIGDLGIAHSFASASCVTGAPAYQAPEFYNDDYESFDAVKEDIWSLGVSMYEVAFGKIPFDGCNAYEIATAARRGPMWPNSASDELKDLLSHILCADPAKRYNLKQIMEHPFMLDAPAKFVPDHDCGELRMDASLSQLKIRVKAEICDDIDFAKQEQLIPRSWPMQRGLSRVPRMKCA